MVIEGNVCGSLEKEGRHDEILRETEASGTDKMTKKCKIRCKKQAENEREKGRDRLGDQEENGAAGHGAKSLMEMCRLVYKPWCCSMADVEVEGVRTYVHSFQSNRNDSKCSLTSLHLVKICISSIGF